MPGPCAVESAYLLSVSAVEFQGICGLLVRKSQPEGWPTHLKELHRAAAACRWVPLQSNGARPALRTFSSTWRSRAVPPSARATKPPSAASAPLKTRCLPSCGTCRSQKWKAASLQHAPLGSPCYGRRLLHLLLKVRLPSVLRQTLAALVVEGAPPHRATGDACCACC